MRPWRLTVSVVVAFALLGVVGCAGNGSGERGGIPAEGPWNEGVRLPAESQVSGDADRGWQALISEGWMTCGVPFRLWEVEELRDSIAFGYGNPADLPGIPGRSGNNADLPYYFTAFTERGGAEVFNANCLMCHGGLFDGELVVGLGNANADFTGGVGNPGVAGDLPLEAFESIGLDAAELAQILKLVNRGDIVAPGTVMRTVGMNPAEILAVELMVHHDRDTLEWSDEPLTEVLIRDREGNPIENAIVSSDPPPWWRVHKKNALFYNGMARGDHRGTMMLATSVCVDNLEDAARVDEWFEDIQAFVRSVRAPKYTRSIDSAMAERGHELFIENCAGCHGTYSDNEEEETYPNLLIPLDVIETDPVVAELGVVHTPELVEWYNGSFYGGITRMEPNNPFPGYMPPPLDGIWATAPFFHNGSVPTVELVLNSKARPRYWKRVDFDTTNFDEEALGWPFVELPYGQEEADDDERSFIYDTTYWSQSNAGHIFGDHFSDSERRAVIEYLKTL